MEIDLNIKGLLFGEVQNGLRQKKCNRTENKIDTLRHNKSNPKRRWILCATNQKKNLLKQSAQDI